MSCSNIRDTLTRATDRSTEVTGHLEACAACRRYAERIDAARELLRTRDAGVQPDPAFVARVRSRLDDDAATLLGRAALRLLPATVALLLLLGWFAWQSTPVSEVETVESPTDDLLSWVLYSDEVGS